LKIRNAEIDARASKHKHNRIQEHVFAQLAFSVYAEEVQSEHGNQQRNGFQ
jgi:hypothetical protein